MESVTLNSTVLQINKNVNVYLPEGYDDYPAESYPVIYLFRGHEDEWLNPNQDASRVTQIKEILDNLYESGQIGQMIVVMPGLTSTDGTIEALGVNMLNSENYDGLETGQFEDYLIQELIPFVDFRFRTVCIFID